jgi:uncharacterized protein YbjQ (UPF0145 family)
MSFEHLRQRMLVAQDAAVSRSPESKTDKGSALSAVSTSETLLLAGSGWEALDVCTGASVYGMRRDTVNTWGSNQDARASKALNSAMAEAVGRLEASCQGSGAHGVIGTRTLVEVQPRYVAVNLIGTAVRPVRAAKAPDRPFTSNLSSRAFLLLVRAGWQPLGLASGGRFVRAYRRSPTQTVRQKAQNVELVNPTHALAQAREATMAVLQERAAEFGGRGVVEVSLSSGRVPFATHVLSFLAWGTVVAPTTTNSTFPVARVAVPLNDLDTAFEPTALVKRTSEDGSSSQ